LAAHLAFLAVAPVFLSPVAVLWLSFSAFVWLLTEPSCRYEERLHDARRRVWSSIVSDPVFWSLILFAGVAALRLINNGIGLGYDAETTQWSLKSPMFPILPGAVKGEGFPEFTASIAGIVVLAGGRNALGRAARISFFVMSSIFAGLYAIALAVWMAMGHDEVRELVACGLSRPSFLGVFFGIALLGGTTGLASVFERHWGRMIPPAMVGICGSAAGLFLFAPAWCGVVFGAAFVLVFLYSFVYLRRNLSAAGEFRYSVVMTISLVLSGVLITATLPKDMLADKIQPWVTGSFFTENYMALRAVLTEIAIKVWRTHPWLGTGLGSFPLDIQFNATVEDWKVILTGQVASVNGYWQLLTERGIIGAFLMAAPCGLTLWTFGQRFWQAVPLMRSTWPEPGAWVGLVTVAALLTDAAADISFLAPGTPLLAFAYLALSANSFPKEKIDG